MTTLVRSTVTVLAGLTLLTMVALFAVKLVRHYRKRRIAFRGAVYISALGEIVSRSLEPTQDMSAWGDDPAFHDTLIDYFGLVGGKDRQVLVGLAHDLGMVERFHNELSTSIRSSVRMRAVAALAVIAAPESRTHLVAALADSSPEVRIEAAAGLSTIGHGDDVREVMRALEDENNWVAERMADALVRFGAVAVPALSNYVLLAGPGIVPAPRHLTAAVRCLGMIGDRSSQTALLTALEGTDPLLRIKAAAALGKPWVGPATTALIRHLQDDDWRVRSQASKALAAHDHPDTIPHLVGALSDPAWWVRQNAATSLGEIDGGIDALFSALALEDQYAVDAALAQLMAHGSLATDDPEKLELLARLGRPHLISQASG